MNIINDGFLEWIKKCEGFNDFPYLDTTGKVTIGYGRNLDAKGISIDEAELLLKNDINDTVKELHNQSWFLPLPPDVQRAMINMCFNLGLPRFLTFKKMIAALNAKDYTKAAQEILDSKWASDVGQRAKDVAVLVREHCQN